MLVHAYAEEHQARLKAEAEAENATRRLAVAQEQIAEYAMQREGEAGHLLGQVAAVHTALASALQQAGEGGSNLSDVGTHVQASYRVSILLTLFWSTWAVYCYFYSFWYTPRLHLHCRFFTLI